MEKKQPAVAIDQVNLGGIADSIYSGAPGSLAALVGFDVHSVPGLMLVNQAFAQDSDATVDDLVKLLPCSDGNMYMFGKTTGEIIKRTAAGAYSLEATVGKVQSTGYLSPGTLADDAAVGTHDWTNPTNAASSNDTYAQILDLDDTISHYLKATNFGAAVPTGSTILGIEVSFEKKTYAGASAVSDNRVSLVNGSGAVQTPNKAKVGEWSTIEDYSVYGGKTDTWDNSTWSVATVNDADFGVVLALSGSGDAAVDHVRIRIFYYDPATAVGILDAHEYGGYIYYAMAGHGLGRWKIGDAWSGRVDTYGVFVEGNTDAHPMIEQNLVLFIGDGQYVAQVDASQSPTIFSDQALTLPANYRTTAFGKQSTNLLVGAKSTSRDNKAAIFPWNTWSVSFSVPAYLQESSINAFLLDDNKVVVSAGINGHFYNYDGVSAMRIKQIPPNFPTLYTPTNTGTVHYPAVANKQGIPIFGFSNVAGNPALQGIYGLGGRNAFYPQILALEFPVSTGNLSNIEIWSIAVIDNDIYVSFKDTTTGTVYRVDKLNWSAKINGAYFETRVMKYTRVLMETFYKFALNYNQNPANTSVALSYKVNHGEYIAFSATEFLNDTIRNQWIGDLELNAKTLQLKAVVTSSGNTAPSIEDMMVLIK